MTLSYMYTVAIFLDIGDDGPFNSWLLAVKVIFNGLKFILLVFQHYTVTVQYIYTVARLLEVGDGGVSIVEFLV